MAMKTLFRLALAAVLAYALSGTVQGADLPREVHGSADAFAAPGLALAWGVLRGADDATTLVTIRIVADPATYARVAITGRDPFTQAERPLLAPTATKGLADLTIPRSHFADFPRTELRLYASPTGDAAPVLVVFYLGVPDTTPEFAQAQKLDVYLAERIERARATARSKTP
jgi:hypothetical protein